jgi:hypothetical protein
MRSNETRNLLPHPAHVSRDSNWIFNILSMKPEQEYMAAVGTMILVAAIAIILVINLIFNL